jgi:hypothetical protein
MRASLCRGEAVLVKNAGGEPGVYRGNSGEGTRTLDTADMSRMLYHLSYAAMVIFAHGL